MYFPFLITKILNYNCFYKSLTVRDNSGFDNIPKFSVFDWNISDSLAAELSEANNDAGKVLTNCEIKFVQYGDCGAEWIKKVGSYQII